MLPLRVLESRFASASCINTKYHHTLDLIRPSRAKQKDRKITEQHSGQPRGAFGEDENVWVSLPLGSSSRDEDITSILISRS